MPVTERNPTPAVPQLATVLLWAPAAVLLLLAGWLLWPSLQARRRSRRLLASLTRLGPELRRELVLENGVDGLAFIDYAVLTPQGIAVVDYLPHGGAIFGGENSDQWAQVIGRRTRRFANPLVRNREHVAALRDNFPRLPVQGLVLFAPEAAFPKGRPDAVVTPADLEQREPPTGVAENLRRAWAALGELAERNAARFQAELAMSRGDRRDGRQLAGWAVLILAALSAVLPFLAAA